MARIVLVLVVCTIVMFFVVLQTPPQFVRNALSPYADFVGLPWAETKDKDKDKDKDKEKKNAAVRQAAARKSPRSSVRHASGPSTTSAAISAATDSKITARPTGTRVSRPAFSVANEGTALYSHNSPSGTIVKVLPKGAIVEPQLEINDAGQMWEFVTVIGENTSGFLRASSLERRQSVQ